MKVLALLTALIAATAAIPVAEPAPDPEIDVYALAGIEVRQTVGITANEFKQGGCRDIIWFFARGSSEVGNMVRPSLLRKGKLDLSILSPATSETGD